MQPQPLMLYRRRWTLIFQVPFTLLMVATLVYGLSVALTTDNKLVAAICWLGAFGSFCIGWTLGRSALDAYQLREPAVTIDACGITDLRDEDPQTVHWQSMQWVKLDLGEDAIFIKLVPKPTDSLLRRIGTTLRRWQLLGDVVVDLRGLPYDAQQLKNTLKAHHMAAGPQSLVPRTNGVQG